MSLITAPATVAIVEADRAGMSTSHYKDQRELVRGLLRHRGYFALIVEEFSDAKAIWDKEAADDAEAERLMALPLPHDADCPCPICCRDTDD